MKAVIAILAGPVLAAAGFTAAHTQPMERACATVIIAQQTITGHEADFPLTLCGGMRRGTWTCYVTPWGPLGAGSRLDCSRVRVLPATRPRPPAPR